MASVNVGSGVRVVANTWPDGHFMITSYFLLMSNKRHLAAQLLNDAYSESILALSNDRYREFFFLEFKLALLLDVSYDVNILPKCS